ncbi:hypothetical protein MF672_041595 [Actinomadura sp. ATCC 31491]|uniref:XRE family transcriptional regulator n=1 Tax=Actinomadura luzonensis TaxID=2805427 RepID=A0ABT0G6K9_9ACTN|nr:hypothetical protein [Actinomadura luzonensis]MCK2220250.1 hypothetical protein [Actinomadura luzonensis]
MSAHLDDAGPDAVTCHEELVRLLHRQFVRSDASLRELQARAERAGGARLPRATCADMLAGRRFPKKAVMVAFLRACRLPADELPAWERAWERVRVTRTPALAGPPQPGDPSPGGPVTPAEDRDGGGAADGAGGVTGGSDGAAGGGTGSGQAGSAGGAPARGAGPVRRRGGAVLTAVLGVLVLAVPFGVLIGRRAASAPAARAAVAGAAGVADPGLVLTDDGRAFGPGGWSRFTVSVDPANTGVRLIRRLDAGVARQCALVEVDGNPAALWRPLPGDDTYKWRDQVVELPPALTAGRASLTVVNRFLSSSLGFNEFLYVVEHRLGGVWRRADRLDVGPAHTADEAAHGYRNARQGWAHFQTFAYPPRAEDRRTR